MKAEEIARALGAAQCSGRWWRCVCPVHGSRTGTSATLALRDGSSGLLAICHAGCAKADVFAELGRRGLFDRAEPVPAAPEPAEDREQRIVLARKIWGMGRDARGTPVARYLIARRITLPPPSCLRWVPSLKLPKSIGDGNTPAMLARIDGPDGQLAGVHRTYLIRDNAGIWRRRARAMLGCAKGGAIRLAPSADKMVIGEGIETTLAAMALTGLSGWAALSAFGIEHLTLPTQVRDVLICVDNDSTGVGPRASRRAGERWLAQGRRVRLIIPNQVGLDINDLLRSAA